MILKEVKMPGNPSPIRRAVTLTARMSAPGLVAGGGVLSGHSYAGIALAACIVVGQLALLGLPVVAAALIAIRKQDATADDTVKLIGALTRLIEKLR
jgi:hypothetical protein